MERPANEINPAQGNDDLGPERQKEFELGFDVGIISRISLDFTYYNKTVQNLLLAARTLLRLDLHHNLPTPQTSRTADSKLD